jgi:DNA repair protein RecO (recombination protein O)
LFSQGELLFFETERSQLVRVDHFDLQRPFLAVREELERLGQGAWVVECLGRLTAERDPHAALYGLLLRALRALETIRRPERATLAFTLRTVDLLGHRLRLDRCLECGRPADTAPRLDFSAGGLLCGACARGTADSIALSGQALGALRRLRTLAWDDLLATPLSRPVEAEITSTLEAHVNRLMGHPLRTARFLVQTRRHLVRPGAPP